MVPTKTGFPSTIASTPMPERDLNFSIFVGIFMFLFKASSKMALLKGWLDFVSAAASKRRTSF